MGTVVCREERVTDLGTYLRRKRQERGLSLERLAALIGWDDLRWQYIRRIEVGDIELPDLDRLTLIARALALPMSEIYARLPGAAGTAYRSAREEGVASEAPRVRVLDRDVEGRDTVPVLPDWLDGRDPETCFVLHVATSDLPDVPRGYLMLFEELRGAVPAPEDIVATLTSRGWWIYVYRQRPDLEPRGRKLKAWEP